MTTRLACSMIAATVLSALVLASALPRDGVENARALGADDVAFASGYARARSINGVQVR